MITAPLRVLLLLVPLWVSAPYFPPDALPAPTPPALALPAASPYEVAVQLGVPGHRSATFHLERGGTLWANGSRHTLPQGTRLELREHRGEVSAKWPRGRASGQRIDVIPPSPRTPWHMARPDGRRTYVGPLHVTVVGEALRVVNTVDLEAYVAGVVTREYGLGDVGGSEAMAILARTYAMKRMNARRAPGEALRDDTGAQVYRGIAPLNAAASAATGRTRGVVLTYGGALVEAVYSSSNGGYVAANETAWTRAEPLPYLRSRPDSYDATSRSPERTWTKRLSRRAVLEAFSKQFGRGVAGWKVASRAEDGRARTIDLIRRGHADERISANAARMALTKSLGVYAMPSTLFEVEVDGAHYVLRGRGFGHGVGLSQWGANARGVAGHDAPSILSFYFPGTQLQRLGPPPPVAPPFSHDAASRVTW